MPHHSGTAEQTPINPKMLSNRTKSFKKQHKTRDTYNNKITAEKLRRRTKKTKNYQIFHVNRIYDTKRQYKRIFVFILPK